MESGCGSEGFDLGCLGRYSVCRGWFTVIGGQARNRIAALDASTGAATAWNPNPDVGWISVLTVAGNTVYAGGDFRTIGGRRRNNIAALSATTGTATAWNPSADSTVSALAISGSTIYVGGYFTSIGGQERHSIAALDATTGVATAWNPNPGPDPDPEEGYGPQVLTLAVSDNTVYAGGWFTSIGGQARQSIAALDARTGVATAWNPNTNNDSYVIYTLVSSGKTVYVGGGFTTIGGQMRNSIAALDTKTGVAKAWNPNAECEDCTVTPINSLALAGHTVYAGGRFTQINNVPRASFAALPAVRRHPRQSQFPELEEY